MASLFRGGATTSAVTIVACIDSAGIMHPGTTHEGCGGMAGVAIQAGYKVGRVGLGILAYRCKTIMAGLTIVHDAGMIKHCTDESACVMTDATILVSW
jgi:hypothetical protein